MRTTIKTRIARALFYFTGGLLLILGSIGLIVSVLPPNVEKFIGMPTEINENVIRTIFMFIKVIGILYIGIGLAVVMLTRQMQSGNSKKNVWIILVLLIMFSFIPVLLAPLGFAPPMVYVPVMLICTITGLILILKEKE
jgi:hypothetical protein